MRRRPLEGITVISLEQAVAAPFATRQLADWGARVIKVERPITGDFARYYDKEVYGLSSHFVWANRNKESMTLNVKDRKGHDILLQLLAHADVIVQNLRPGVMQTLGLTNEFLRTKYPRLVCCNISGFGRGGPYETRKAYDLLIQAESGLLSITGTLETPVKVGISVADIAAGMYAFSGILAALVGRGQTGNGTVVDVSMLDALAEWMGYPLNFSHFGGTSPSRTGPHHATIAPYGPYSVLNNQVIYLAVQNDREWAAFCQQVLRKPDLIQDLRYCDNENRVAHRKSLDTVIEDAFGKLTLEEAVQRLESARIAHANLNTMEKLWNHPQLHARKRWSSITTEKGAVETLLPPMDFEEVNPRMDRVPALGEDTDHVLEELGFSADRRVVLHTLGVV